MEPAPAFIPTLTNSECAPPYVRIVSVDKINGRNWKGRDGDGDFCGLRHGWNKANKGGRGSARERRVRARRVVAYYGNDSLGDTSDITLSRS